MRAVRVDDDGWTEEVLAELRDPDRGYRPPPEVVRRTLVGEGPAFYALCMLAGALGGFSWSMVLHGLRGALSW